MAIEVFDLEYIPGADLVETVTYTDSTGAAVDLTGASADLITYDSATKAQINSYTIGDGLTVADPTNGQIAILIPTADLAALTDSAIYTLAVTIAAVKECILRGALKEVLGK